MILVSVIMPTYNRCEKIRFAIQSVLDQTFSDLEVIVVDDRSNDNTVQILEEFAQSDPRVRWLVHNERKGPQAARNTGIRAARGEWIAFLDSDDQWLPDSLEIRLRLAREMGTKVVHSDWRVRNPPNVKPKSLTFPYPQGRIYKEVLRKSGPVFQALLVSKESLARIGYLDEKIVAFQEWDTAIRLAKHYEFSFVPKPTFIYDCRHPDSISKDLLRAALGYKQVFTKNRWAIIRLLGPKALAFHYQTAATLHRAANENAQAFRCLLIAFLLWPFRPDTIVRTVRRCFQWQFNVSSRKRKEDWSNES
jgi:glycosyltransferase involved in cell wall biosynthesis